MGRPPSRSLRSDMAYNYTYHLMSKACTDLEEILNYLSGNLANPTAASRFWSKLNAVIQETQSFPFSGPTVPYVLPQDTPGMPVRKNLSINMSCSIWQTASRSGSSSCVSSMADRIPWRSCARWSSDAPALQFFTKGCKIPSALRGAQRRPAVF